MAVPERIETQCLVLYRRNYKRKCSKTRISRICLRDILRCVRRAHLLCHVTIHYLRYIFLVCFFLISLFEIA